MILMEDIKKDKEDNTIYRDSDTGMPVFRVREEYDKRKTATWHEDMLAVHPDLATGFMPRKFSAKLTKSEVASWLNHKYEDHANHDFTHPFKVVPNQEFTLVQNGEKTQAKGDHIYDPKSGERIGTIHTNGDRIAFSKEFAEKNKINDDVRKAFTTKINSSMYHPEKYKLLDEYLSHANKVPKIVGHRNFGSTKTYKKADDVSMEEASKMLAAHHSKGYENTVNLNWEHIGNGHHIAHETPNSEYSTGYTHHIMPVGDDEIHYFRRAKEKDNRGSANTTMLF